MSKKALIWTVVCIVVLVALGPIFVAKVANKLLPVPKQVSSGALQIKASGTLSLADGVLLLTTPKGVNNYILSGGLSKDMEKYAGKGTPVYVFGQLVRAAQEKVQGKAIRAAIDVAQFDTKDFAVGQPMTSAVADSIRQKVQEKMDFRAAVLKKLGLKPDLDVIHGTLTVFHNLTISSNKQGLSLGIVDKYGDVYVLYNAGGITNPVDSYIALANSKIDVVVTGEVTLPHSELLIVGQTKFIPFSAEGIYNNNDNLSPIVISK